VKLVALAAKPIDLTVLDSPKFKEKIYVPNPAFLFKPTLDNNETVPDPRRSNCLMFIPKAFIVTLVATTLSLVLVAPAAYSMSRLVMRKSGTTVLLARIIPGMVILLPGYYIFSQLEITGGFLPLTLYIITLFPEPLAQEFGESGKVHGLTTIAIFLRISLLLSISRTGSAFVLSFILSWNNIMFALVLSGPTTETLPLAAFDLIGYASIDRGARVAASVVVTTPIMLIPLFTQRYIVSELTAGATKEK
jgi:multiple sugar transport system permease protein